MLFSDFIRLAFGAVVTQRTRSLLTALGIAVGIAAVVLLTSIGEGIHRFVLAEFTQFGTNLIGITPGKATTMGISGALFSNVRPLSIDDAEALKRIPQVQAVVPSCRETPRSKPTGQPAAPRSSASGPGFRRSGRSRPSASSCPTTIPAARVPSRYSAQTAQRALSDTNPAR